MEIREYFHDKDLFLSACKDCLLDHYSFSGILWIFSNAKLSRISTLKGTNGHHKTYEIFHVYCIIYSGFMYQTTVIFGITKDGSLVLNTLVSWNCFTCRNLFQNGANDMSECLTCETAFCKKLKILYSSDHLILIKFPQLVVNIVIKELQMAFLTSTVINSNGNMKELERKIKCEKLMIR